jgi:hypothetical protein
MSTTRLNLGILLCAVAVACSHPMKENPGATGGAGGNGGFGGGDGGFSGGGGAPVGGFGGGDGGFRSGDGSGGFRSGGVIGTGGCWWTKPSGAGGVQPGEADGWPDSPARAPGTAVSRSRVDAWNVMSLQGAPSGPRNWATAVWTGKEMIVWGGEDGKSEATGGRYDPATDTWKPTSTSVAPRPRSGHVAVWTGTEMIVWGGYDGSNVLLSGGRYDPATDTWAVTSTTGAPANASEPRAVWAGKEMIVWGGQDTTGVASGAYNPSKDAWRPLSTIGAPLSQLGASLVWTGSEVIVWGGYVPNACASALGALYDPATDTWRPMTSVGAPHPRLSHSAVWTGTQMIVWGGSNLSPNAASYDPVADAWFAISEVDAPSIRSSPALFFLPDPGTPGAGRMLLWGGAYGNDAITGALYDFVPDLWEVVAPFPTIDASPNPGSTRTTVWTGSELLVWDVAFGVGGRYRP